MRTIPVSEIIHAPKRKWSAAWKSYALFTLCASLYLLPFMRVMFVARDEGTFLYGAVRIVHGQVFARDFFEVMGPGTFYWLAAFFKIFGVTFLASRICLFVSSLGTALSIFFLSQRVCTRYRTLPCLILAGTYFGGIWPEINHHVDSNFFALLAVVCLILWYEKRKSILLLAAGALAGVTTSIHQPKGLLLFFAFMAWLCLQRRRASAPWSSLALIAGGYLAFIALVLAYFFSKGAVGSLLYANVDFPRQHYAAVNTVGYAQYIFTVYWAPWVATTGSKWLAGIASILVTPLLFVAALPLLVLIFTIRFDWKSATPEIALYWLCGWSIWLSEFHRRDIFHLVFGSPLLILFCIFVLSGSSKKTSDLALQILAICSVCLVGSNLCFALAEGTHTLETRMGKVAALGQEEELKFLNEHVAPGDEILIYPYCPTLYFLSSTTNPTRYSLLVNNYNTPAQFLEVAAILDRRRVRYVIWDTTLESKAKINFPGSQPTNPRDLIIEPYLESHYTVVKDDQGILVMERKGEGPAKY